MNRLGPFGQSRRELLQLGAGACGAFLVGPLTGCATRVAACRTAPPNPFVARGRPLLVVVEGEDPSAMLRKGIEALGGLDKLLPGGREALLKANYIAAQPYPVTTASDFIVAVAREMKSAGFTRTSLFEANGTHLAPQLAPDAAMRKLGVLDQMARNGVDVVAGDHTEPNEFRLVRNPAWSIPAAVAVHRRLHEAGVVVSLPVLKRHGDARLTCALKLHFGSVQMADRMIAHKNGAQGRRDYFDDRLVHFADAVKPQLNLVDARAILARSGPVLGGGGEVVRGVNRIVLCGDMVATDAYCARLMAEHDPTFTPEMITRQLQHAAALGLGVADLDAVEIVSLRT
jgi:uncharacterized protein (DUF362 family)